MGLPLRSLQCHGCRVSTIPCLLAWIRRFSQSPPSPSPSTKCPFWLGEPHLCFPVLRYLQFIYSFMRGETCLVAPLEEVLDLGRFPQSPPSSSTKCLLVWWAFSVLPSTYTCGLFTHLGGEFFLVSPLEEVLDLRTNFCFSRFFLSNSYLKQILNFLNNSRGFGGNKVSLLFLVLFFCLILLPCCFPFLTGLTGVTSKRR